jgi:DNA-binding CsgD family transcriptional regulator
VDVERILTCFEGASSEDELWNRFARLARDEFGVTSILYGFTHNKYVALRTGITKSLYIRHNHPEGYIDAYGRDHFLDTDPCATELFATGASVLWDNVYAVDTRDARLRQEIGRAFDMDIGVTVGLTFGGGAGITGAGFSAGPQRAAEFRKVWEARGRELEALFAAFDARLRPTMIANRIQLSPRERDVIAYAAAGHSGKEIARHLGMRPKSVFNVMDRARKALQASTTFEAIAKAYAYNLI